MAGPSFISSIKFQKPFVTTSCTSLNYSEEIIVSLSARNYPKMLKTLKTYKMGFATISLSLSFKITETKF